MDDKVCFLFIHFTARKYIRKEFLISSDNLPHLQAVSVTLPHRCWLEMLGGQEDLREQTE